MISYNKKLDTIQQYLPSSRKSGDEVAKLDWNECTLPIDERFNNILLTSLNEINFFEYPNINNVKLLEALASYCCVNINNIQIFNGSDSALHHIFATFLNDDSKVLIYYPNYTQVETYIKLYTNKIIYSNIVDPFYEHNYEFDIIKDVDVIYFSNPNNPTGVCLDYSSIQQLIETYPNKLFIIDEAYYEFSKKTCSHLVNNFNNLIITRTFSKAFSLASMRLGYICTSPILIEYINKIRNTKEVSSFAQILGLKALENYNYVDDRIKVIVENREKFKKILEINKIIFTNSEANFVLIKVNDSNYVTKILYDNDILVRNRGMFYGIENTIRITIGNLDNNKKIIDLINKCHEYR